MLRRRRAPSTPGAVDIVLAPAAGVAPRAAAAPAYGIVAAAGRPPTARRSPGPSVGSGPFRLAERDGDIVSLVRAPDGEALVDRIELHQHDDLAAAFDAFEGGLLDWTLVPPARVEAAAERYGTDGFVPFQAELFFGFNLPDPTFADVRFRQAIVQPSTATPSSSAVYFGFASPARRASCPPGVPGADPARCGDGCAPRPRRRPSGSSPRPSPPAARPRGAARLRRRPRRDRRSPGPSSRTSRRSASR